MVSVYAMSTLNSNSLINSELWKDPNDRLNKLLFNIRLWIDLFFPNWRDACLYTVENLCLIVGRDDYNI